MSLHVDLDDHELLIGDGLDIGAQECHNLAAEKGFHDDEVVVEQALNTYLSYYVVGSDTDFRESLESARAWFKSTCEQAEIARMHSELSEWLETVRKNPGLADDHCPEFLSVEIEAADLIFRVLDTCGKRGYRIGDAFLAKWKYNKGRPFKHGKNS